MKLKSRFKKIYIYRKSIVNFIFITLSISIVVYSLINMNRLPIEKLGFLFALSIFFIFSDKLLKLKAFGLEVELQQKINEADHLIEQTKNLAKMLAIPILKEQIYGCFGWGDKRLARIENYEAILKSLLDIGITESEIEELKKQTFWYKGVSTMYWNAISYHIAKRTGESNQINRNEPEREGFIKNLNSQMCHNGNVGDWEILSKEAIENEMIKNDFSTHIELKSWLDAYGDFCKTGIIARKNDLLLGNY